VKLYATIRKESIYSSSQQEYDSKQRAIPFEVVLDFQCDPYWPVRGGIGGRYALFDVHLWIRRGEKFSMLPVHNRPY